MKTPIYILLSIFLIASALALPYPYSVPTCNSCRPSIHTTIGDQPNYRIPYYAYQGQRPYIPATPEIPEHATDEYLSSNAPLQDKEDFLAGYEEGYTIAQELQDNTARDPYYAMRIANSQLQKQNNPYDWGFEAGYYDGVQGSRNIPSQPKSALINSYIKERNAAKGGIYWNQELWKSDQYTGPVQKNTVSNPFWGFRYQKGLVCNGKTCTRVNVFY